MGTHLVPGVKHPSDGGREAGSQAVGGGGVEAARVVRPGGTDAGDTRARGGGNGGEQVVDAGRDLLGGPAAMMIQPVDDDMDQICARAKAVLSKHH